jgi:hypothetical protein
MMVAAWFVVVPPAEAAPVVLIVESGDSTDVAEGGGTDTYTVALEDPPTTNVVVNLETTDGQVSVDTPASQQLTFTTSDFGPKTVIVSAVNDSAVEGAHTGTVTHTIADGSATEYLSADPDPVVVNVADNNFSVDFVQGSSSPTEGNSGSTPVLIDVELETNGQNLGSAASVQVVRTGGTAGGTDYSFTSPSLVTFPAGSSDGTTRSVTLNVTGDTIDEGTETVVLGLQNVSTNGAISGQTSHRVDILDDDDAFSVSFATPTSSVPEGNDLPPSTANVRVVLSTGTPLTSAASVDVVLTGGSATAGTDFSYTSPTQVTFGAGSGDGEFVEVQVSIIGDTTPEVDETVELGLQNVSTGGTIGSPSTHTLTIATDDTDTLAVAFAAASSSVTEGDAGVAPATVRVVLSTPVPLTVPATASVVYAGGTATPGSDFSYTAVAPQVTFPVGSASGTSVDVPVSIIGDTTDEVDETVVFEVQPTSAGAIAGSPSIHTLKITDNDNDAPAITSLNTLDLADNGRFEFGVGELVKVRAAFTDEGAQDSHTVFIDWGDGTVPTTFVIPAGGERVIERTHTYASEAVRTILVRVNDDVDTASKTALVAITGTGGGTSLDTIGLVDTNRGFWALYDSTGTVVNEFYYGVPGDYPFMGDWNCDGIETPGLYRQSDGYAYLRNLNTQGIADVRFFFGNPGDVPIAGDFNGDGCDTVSIYRPSNQTFYIINKLGANDGGLGAAELSYVFGNPGDKPFVGDFDGDGIETAGLHRESTGLVYFRNSHTQGIADHQFIFGDPGDRIVAGDWNGDTGDAPAVYRTSDRWFYFRHTNTQGTSDSSFYTGVAGWMPVAGFVGL